MKSIKLLQWISVITLITLLLSGCGPGQMFGPTITLSPTHTPIPPTSTNTPVPLTATDTPVPPTATNTPVPPTETLAPTATPSGLWQATADFGEFHFIVNPEKTLITKITFKFLDWSCGPTTMSGSISVGRASGWSVSQGRFNITQKLDQDGKQTIAISGKFDETTGKASGTWKANSHGTPCSGTWGTP